MWSESPVRSSIAESTPCAMSGDWEPIAMFTPQDAPSKPFLDESYPMRRIVSRTIVGMSAYALVVTSPATCTWPVVISVSTATRLRGSSAIKASSTPSLIWSAILSGWPSVTDSEVNRRRAIGGAPYHGSWHRRAHRTGARRSDERKSSRNSAIGRQPASSTLPGVSGEAGEHEVPDRVGQVILGRLRDLGDRAVGAQHGGGVDVLAERLVHPDLVEHHQVGP